MSRQSITLTFGERNNLCCECGGDVVLVKCAQWKTYPADYERQEVVEPHGQVSGHYCPACNRLTAIFHRTLE